MGNSSRKPYFYLSDSYRYHVLTNDESLYKTYINLYMDKITKEDTENNFGIGRIYLHDSEYRNHVKETQHYNVNEKCDNKVKKNNSLTIV